MPHEQRQTMPGNWSTEEGREQLFGKLPGPSNAQEHEIRHGRSGMGIREPPSTHWQQEEDEQQEEEELGDGGGVRAEQQEAETFKIVYTNAQSILGKLTELSAYVADVQPDLILLVETSNMVQQINQ